MTGLLCARQCIQSLVKAMLSGNTSSLACFTLVPKQMSEHVIHESRDNVHVRDTYAVGRRHLFLLLYVALRCNIHYPLCVTHIYI